MLKGFGGVDQSETLGEGFSGLKEYTIKVWKVMCISLGVRNFRSVWGISRKITQLRRVFEFHDILLEEFLYVEEVKEKNWRKDKLWFGRKDF